MTEVDLDKEYLDEVFIGKVNTLENDQLEAVIKVILENYEIELSYEKIEYLNQMVKSLYSNEANPEHFLRQMKYLINKGIYNRLLKKYKNELIELGVNADKVELLTEIQKRYFEDNQRKNEAKAKNDALTVKDFGISTEMPVYYSNYSIAKEGVNNEDVKKQNIVLDFKLAEDSKEMNYKIKVEKDYLINLYEQMEKIQEKIDKLS